MSGCNSSSELASPGPTPLQSRQHEADGGCVCACQVLRDPNLVRWFAQNNDVSRPKLSPVPIGLNCFEHAPEMAQARRLIGPS